MFEVISNCPSCGAPKNKRHLEGCKLSQCPDCGVYPGEDHKHNCDVERCAYCGGQVLSCGCSEEEYTSVPPIPWTGLWPGVAECREFGWYAKLVPGKGWVQSDASDPEASEDLNRLYSDETVWDRAAARFVKKDIVHVIIVPKGGPLDLN